MIGRIETVADLIAHLEQFDEDLPIALAIQPNYPFEHSIAQVVEAEIDGQTKVFIGEGSQVGYLPGEASEELGWR